LSFRFPFLSGGLAQIEKDIRRVFYDAFKKTDGDFLREACQQRPHWRDGSTASVVLLVNNTLYIANLGDSKVVLAREVEETVDADSTTSTAGNGSPKSALITAVSLTRDHNPMDYEERQRIQATGATVQNGRVNNILEVSRSFGDYQFKKQGVTCLPDVRKCQLTTHDRSPSKLFLANAVGMVARAAALFEQSHG
ncbi:integrin-linked kinase-associated serine/threonine phosphatase 2C, partial [Paragonimus westermani]